MGAAGNQAGDVGHVHHQVGVHRVGDGTETGEVENLGVGAATGHDQLGLVLLGQPFNFVVVDVLSFLVHAVGDEVVELAREVDSGAVGEVAAVGQFHAHHGVAGLQQGEVNGHVGLGAAVGLDVGVLGAEKFPGPIDGQGLDDVDVLAAAIVAAAGVALGVLVVHYAGLGFQDSLAGIVFGSDKDHAIALAGVFQFNGAGDRRVLLGKQGHKKSLPF